MAPPYGTIASLEITIGKARTAALAVLDTTSPTYNEEVIAECRDKADNEIDATLGTKWPVPFASLTDTPGLIQDLSDLLTAFHLYSIDHPNGEDAKHFRAQTDLLFGRLLSGEASLPGVSPLPADQAPIGFAHGGTTPQFAGYDADGRDRTDLW